METSNETVPPTSEQARAALAAARAEENTTVNRPGPAWYYPVLAGAIFTLFALNSIEGATGAIRALTGALALVLAVAVGGLVGMISVSHPGYKHIHIKWGPTILAGLIALAFPVAAIVLAGVIGSWVWIASGAVFAMLLMIVGVAYQRKHRDG